mmetsp:Transcript_89988/g.145614  ORF Transcript_89988/g.145614 Transcript_89988/m.145614 type:complete len:190 (-) Transcript_89988:129-698(-)|eukprot:CAMPEP_0179420016 /NCGR_PEP_ID=MMETSP0799-20121207/8933_1 /TAXON_ID=46947 /ORGANISM="Geminigera cryophila, Strain CCMP2564" /LENGTH=189 /DNA_ID=CAMNT_0021193579 /DNA_START=21 /DNA_END=590 /DNA_ORIENTATION=+
MAKPLVSQVFGKIKDYRMKLGNHETRGGHEIRLGLRVCMYEEYMAATHHLRKDLGRISEYWNYFIVSGLDSLQGGQHGNELRLQETPRLVGGTISRILPGNFSCEVEWDNGQKGIYFQSALYYGDDVPPRNEDSYRKLMNSRQILDQRPDLRRKRAAEAAKKLRVGHQDPAAVAKAHASHTRWARWRPN